MSSVAVAALFFLLCAGCNSNSKLTGCEPLVERHRVASARGGVSNVTSGPAGARLAASRTRIYLDGSATMSGYMIPADRQDINSANAADFIRELSDTVARETSDDITFRRVGEGLTNLSEDAFDAAIQASFYTCPLHRCDNQQTRLDLALKEVQEQPPGTLSLLLSDMFITQSGAAGSSFEGLRRPLKAILKSGQSIGLIAIRAQFHGVIQDFSDDPLARVRDATSRPFFVMLVGPRERVERLGSLLVNDVLAGISGEKHFVVFSRQFVGAAIEVDEAKTWFRHSGPVDVIPSETSSVRFPEVAMTLGSGSMAYEIPVTRAFAPYARNIRAHIVTTMWRKNAYATDCNDTWQKVATPPQLASISQSNTQLTVSLFPKSVGQPDLLPGETYLLRVQLLADADPVAVSREQWVQQWSFSDDQSKIVRDKHPSFFPTRNLSRLVDVLRDGAFDNSVTEPFGELRTVVTLRN